MDGFPMVSIITVNYAQANVTCELISSLRSITYPNYEIIVIDNASQEDPGIIQERFPEIILIRSTTNIGFAGANNLGISIAKGEYLMFLNNDTEVDQAFLEPLIRVLQTDKSIGAVSPKVLYHNSNIIQYAGAKKVNPYTGRAFSHNYQEIDNGLEKNSKPTYYAFGAAMMVPKKVIDKIGPMPEIYFMYYEEIEWCEKIWRSGYKIDYVESSTVYHKDSISIGIDSPQKTYFLNRNRILFLRRNTSLIQQCISFCYLNLLVAPKQIILYLFKGRIIHLKYYLKALGWHLTHLRVNP